VRGTTENPRTGSRAAYGPLLVTLLLLAVSCTKTTVAGLMIEMSTDGTLQPDLLSIDVTSLDGSMTYRNASYKLPAEASLPTSVAIASNGDPTASVAISASVWAGGIPLDIRQDRVFEIPTDHLAYLYIVFSANCTPQVSLVEGAAVSKCPAGETCDPKNGSCVSDVMSSGGDGGSEREVSPGDDAGEASAATGAACAPGTAQCSGNAVQTCDGAGEWGIAAACPASAPFCNGPGACGSCEDRSTRCAFNAVQTCIMGAWSPAVSCPPANPSCGAGTCGQPPSCQVTAPGTTQCGATSESCCTSEGVTGGPFDRTYSYVSNGPHDGAPATVSDFRLDKYEVTVGRFRQFVAAYNGGWTAPAGAGKHTYLNGGRGLEGSGNTGAYEPGWVTSDGAYVAPTDSNLECGGGFSTWTPSPADSENLPINCVNWWESYAFCIWDEGFLPSEAESDYAAAGGGEQREYPWGNTDPGTMNQYAIYACYYPSGSGTCAGLQNIAPVGTAALGAGLWGQLDLVGNVWPWTLDWFGAYAVPCIDCTDLTTGPYRTHGSADFHDPTSYLVSSAQHDGNPPQYRDTVLGFRCARSP
jgi:formylglycine-generating enzyme